MIGPHSANGPIPECRTRKNARLDSIQIKYDGKSDGMLPGCGVGFLTAHPSLSSTASMLALVMMASSHLNHWSLCVILYNVLTMGVLCII